MMDLYVLNSGFNEIDIIDTFSSLIWTTRYYEADDFELYLPVTPKLLNTLKIGNFLYREDSENVMIIERLEIKTDIENGNYLIVSGRDLKSLLDRRAIWKQSRLTGTVETALYALINSNCGSDATAYRQFTNFTTATTKGFTETIDAQVTGESLYEYVVEVCRANNYGWRIKLTNVNHLVCEIFKGSSRPEIYFSPEFDNLINSDYIIDSLASKNMAYVAGEGEGTKRTTISVNETQGFNRRELYVDARDLSSNEGEISSTDYVKLLQARGQEKLAELPITQSFSGNVVTEVYEYKTDYDIGDVVTVENEYGITAETRIIEVIESWSEDGSHTVIPTFESWEV